MPERLRALLFDLDGTLVHTAAANAAAYGAALREVGVEVGDADLATTAAGRHWRQFLPELLARAGSDAEPAVVAERKKALYPSTFGQVRVNDGLVALARSARPRLRAALVTTASAANVAAILDHFALANLFDVVVTGDDVAHHKPAPDAWLRATELLGVEPSSCLAFEDSAIGIESARCAGIQVVRVSW